MRLCATTYTCDGKTYRCLGDVSHSEAAAIPDNQPVYCRECFFGSATENAARLRAARREQNARDRKHIAPAINNGRIWAESMKGKGGRAIQ